MAAAVPPGRRRSMDADDDCAYRVELFVYDLTRGLARTLSPTLLGKQIDGVWHTGVVAYGREYFFGSGGIESCKPGGTILGEPDRIEELGESQVPYQLFLEYIFGLGESSYRPGAYDLLKHNCNNFSDDIAQFLCGRGIPKAILQLPEEVLNTPLGITLNDALKKLELKHASSRSISFGPLSSSALGPAISVVRTSYEDPEFDALNDAIEQVRHNSVLLEKRRNSLNDKLSKKERKERRREKRERKEQRRRARSEASNERIHKNKKSKPPLPPSDSPGNSSLSTSFSLHTRDSFNDLGSRHSQEEDELPEDEFFIARDTPSAAPQSSVDHCQNNAFTETVDDTTASVEGLSLSENAASGDWEPVDDFWGQQAPDSPIVVRRPSPYHPSTTDPELPAASSEQYPDSPSPPHTHFTDMEDAPPSEAVERSAAPPASAAEPEEPEVQREPPILFKEDVDARRDFDELVGCCMHQLSPEEQQHMEELRAYVVEDDGAWALGENFGDLFTRIFHDPNIPDTARLHLTRILAVAALKDDVILLLHQDRKDHTIMNFANKVEHLSPELQEAIALFFCNMFEHLSPSEWLLYISEWTQESSMPISNIRVTTKVAVNALLHPSERVQNYGTALMYNLGTKEVKTVVFDDVAPELAMAILQFFNTKPKEELLWRTITALCRFCYASNEVPSLIKMIGPEPSMFKGISERVDSVIDEINAKLSRVRLF
ncbi:uncharacterized protein LOC108679354 isoform X3 [Hyalella azteca]|uniref:Uncharacterized protein LOC108679354 isoform X3 n=1 Tax=Hyalella azteca TaxID=294128 RepID=A0A8B7PBS6_HYAAZ|nr:uncharacterized protein LOC108679354 isoform X3 [Hyalella azteca]